MNRTTPRVAGPVRGGALTRRLRERRRAARDILELMPYAGLPLVFGTLVVHLVAGSAPIVFMVGTAAALSGLAAGELPWTLWLAVGAFLVQQVLAPVQLMLSREIARRVDAGCITRMMHSALDEVTLAGLERPEVADSLSQVDEAFEQWTLTPGAAVEGALALTARYTQLVGAVVVLTWAAGPWAGLAGLVAALVARAGQTEAFHQWGGVIRAITPIRRRASYVRELATGTRAAKEIRSLGLLGWLVERFEAENRSVLDTFWTSRRRVYGTPFLGYAAFALVGTLVALLTLAVDGSGGERLMSISLAVQAIALCGRFGVMFPESDVKLVYGRSAWDAIRTFERVAGRRSEPRDLRPATRPERSIALEKVVFGYEPGRSVLDGLDLELPVGRSTALIGVNGAGKTTLVKMLAGIYEPDDGTVRVDGIDLRELDPDSWQRQFAVTFQDYLRYELSLRENVAMGSIDNQDDDEGIVAELIRVGLGDLLESLPAGLDTPLTRALPGGRELSGGQWQRIAVARSLFAVRHGATVLVLDEPTAQLDARGEAEFYDMFIELTHGVTSLIISHRFSSVRRADQIVVLDGGRVTESGDHDTLVRQGGQYSHMFGVQAQRFTAAGTGSAEEGTP